MKTKQILGLDLGSTAFKLVLLEAGDSRPRLTRARLIEVPPGADAAVRQEVLKQLLQGVPLAEVTQTVSVVDDPFLCLQQVLVPPIPPAELPGAIRWELQRYLAVPPEQVIVDYQPMGEVEAGGIKKRKLLAIAVPTGTVQEHVAFLAQAGIRPTQLVPPAIAAASWFTRRGRLGTAPVALLDLGASTSCFLVVQDGLPVFTRKIPIAGLEITKGMTGVLMTTQGQVGLTDLEAESIKREVGIPPADVPLPSVRGISGIQLLSLIRGTLDRLAVEVERSLSFYGELTPGAGVSEMILVGGGAHMKRLAEWMQERLGLPVGAPSPLEGIPQAPGAVEASVGDASLSLVQALGAALEAGVGVNLLPAEMKTAAQTRVKRLARTGALTALILGIVLFQLGISVYRQSLTKQVDAFRIEEAAIRPEFIKAKAARAANDRLAQEVRWEDVFRELSQVVPREIYLTGLSFDGRQVLIRGRVRDLGRAPDSVLSEFLRELGKGSMTQVRLNTSRQLDYNRETEFEVGCLCR